MKRLLLAAITTLMVTGCYNAKITAPVRQGGIKHSDTGASLFWGLTNSTSAALECPGGMAYTETYFPWWGQIFIQPLTLGIVTPIKKVWICADPAAAAAPAAQPQIVIMQAPAAK